MFYIIAGNGKIGPETSPDTTAYFPDWATYQGQQQTQNRFQGNKRQQETLYMLYYNFFLREVDP